MNILKFLHASDFRLHLPVTPFIAGGSDSGNVEGGLYSPLSEEVLNLFLRAAWKSATNVFDFALKEKVDFLLLTGDLLNPQIAGARGLKFLADQFTRLEEAGIEVYCSWQSAGGDAEARQTDFPKNVHIFPKNKTKIEKFRLRDEKKSVFLVSWKEGAPNFDRYDFTRLPNRKLPHFQTISVHGAPGGLKFSEVCHPVYAACGNQNTKILRTLSSSSNATENAAEKGGSDEITVHAPGTIQFRTPEEWRDSGCLEAGMTLVQVDLDGTQPLAMTNVPTAQILWELVERTIPTELKTVQEVTRWLLAQQNELSAKFAISKAECVLLTWHLRGETEAQLEILREIQLENVRPETESEVRISETILKELRTEGAKLVPQLWSTQIETARDVLIPRTWVTADNMLGDFLRLAEFHENNPEAGPDVESPFANHSLNLSDFLTAEQKKDEFLRRIVPPERSSEVLEILRNAAIQGATMLHASEIGDEK